MENRPSLNIPRASSRITSSSLQESHNSSNKFVTVRPPAPPMTEQMYCTIQYFRRWEKQGLLSL